MSPADLRTLADGVATEATDGVCDLLRDYLASGEGFDTLPPALMALHRSVGHTLADRLLLVLDEATEQGDVEDEHDIAEVERVSCTRLVARLAYALGGLTLINAETVDAGSAELCRAFRERIDAHYRAPRGGSA